MDSLNVQAPTNLSGTTWSVASPSNGDGTIQFNTDNTATYTTTADPTRNFYWWQNGASFWMQEKHPQKGWFAIIEGQLTGTQSGNGNIIAAQQGTDSIYVAAFTMEPGS